MAIKINSDPLRSLPTRERLLQVAELLFARHGIEAVSLNRIRNEANERNSSALNYYFGSKEGLIEAILAYRMHHINARRLELLSKVDCSDRERGVRSVVRAIVIPFAEQLDGRSGERNYVRFVAQVYSNPDHNITALLHNQNASGVRKAIQLLRNLLHDLPPQITNQRIELVQSLVIHALANRERAIAVGHTELARASMDTFVDTLITMATAGLLAPLAENIEKKNPDHCGRETA